MRYGPKKKRVLIAGPESDEIAALLDVLTRAGYGCVRCPDVREVPGRASETLPDLILLDDMDTSVAVSALKESKRTAPIPIILMTEPNRRAAAIRSIARGADDYISKPLDINQFLLRLRNYVQLKEYHDFKRLHSTILEVKVDEKANALGETVRGLDRSNEHLRTAYIDTIYRLALVAEYKDEDTGAHIKRSSLYARELASSMGLDDEFLQTIYYAAPMHDLGKVAIPDRILLKEDMLVAAEWDVMRSHTVIGGQILEGSSSPFLQMAREIALYHHERWDGTGYPEGLKSTEIPIAARIMNLADQYDALRRKRPYKEPFSHEKAYNIITKGDGRTAPDHFDPKVLEAFKSLNRVFFDIYRTNADPE